MVPILLTNILLSQLKILAIKDAAAPHLRALPSNSLFLTSHKPECVSPMIIWKIAWVRYLGAIFQYWSDAATPHTHWQLG
jgi:hypothetical protein